MDRLTCATLRKHRSAFRGRVIKDYEKPAAVMLHTLMTMHGRTNVGWKVWSNRLKAIHRRRQPSAAVSGWIGTEKSLSGYPTNSCRFTPTLIMEIERTRYATMNISWELTSLLTRQLWNRPAALMRVWEDKARCFCQVKRRRFCENYVIGVSRFSMSPLRSSGIQCILHVRSEDGW